MSALHWCDRCNGYVNHETAGHPGDGAHVVVRDAIIDALRKANEDLTAQIAAITAAAEEKWKYQTHCLICGISANHGRFKHADNCVLANLPGRSRALLDLVESAREADAAGKTVAREHEAFGATGRTASRERLDRALDALGRKLAAYSSAGEQNG